MIIPDADVEIATPNVIELARDRQPLPATLTVVEQPETVVDLTALTLYKLRGESVIRIADLAIQIPATIKRFWLHKREVVRLADIETYLATL